MSKVKDQRLVEFLKRRFKSSGCDYDYVGKLSEENLDFLKDFTKGYYNGETDSSVFKDDATKGVVKKEANHRRYMASTGDVMAHTDDVDPYRIASTPSGSASDHSPELLTIQKLTPKK